LYHIDFGDFKDLVGYGDVRPERPTAEDAPQLSNAMWELAEKCWAKDPDHRPIASTVCDALSIQLDIAAPTRPTPNPPAPPSRDMTARPSIDRPLDSPSSTLTIRGNNVSVNCAAFSLDGEYIVSGSAGGDTQVWDAQQGNSEKSPSKPITTPINCVAFSPYGPRIATGYSDGGVRVFNSVTGRQITSYHTGISSLPAVWSVCLSPNGYAVSGCDNGEIEIWSATSGAKRDTLKGHTDRVTALAFNKGGTRLASGSHDWTVRVWDMSTYKVVQGPLRGPRDLINFVAFSVDGATVVALSRNRDICVWRTDTGGRVSLEGQAISPLLFTPNSSWSAISPDGKWIASVPVGNRNAVLIINSKTGMVVSTFEEHTGWVQTLSFSPDSKRVLSASVDKTIKVHTLKF
jgi:WD40 repeat protein